MKNPIQHLTIKFTKILKALGVARGGRYVPLVLLASVVAACDSAQVKNTQATGDNTEMASPQSQVKKIDVKPLVEHIYTADPSAHVFENKLYIYPSHDWASDKPQDDLGTHFDMKDYHVLSMDRPGAKVTDHGVALKIEDILWAKSQLWAPDAAEKNGKYYLYFPAKDHDGIFKIGVAVSDSPSGPFVAEPQPIAGTYSIDPAVYEADDGHHYLYVGGIWGGQLQRYKDGVLQATDRLLADDEPALRPLIARLASDMVSLAEPLQPIDIIDEHGELLKAGDHDRRFFEAAWVHKFKGKYYLSYSTGNTHKIVYATSDSLYGPFAYQGVILNPVLGWTNHHSIAEFEGKWYLFFHDSSLSKGQTHLRSVKMAELHHNDDGSIQTLDALVK